MIRRLLSTFAAVSLLLCVPATLSAQNPSISVSGTSSVKSLPGAVRVVIMLRAKGNTFLEALGQLKSERQSALEKLEKAGFDKEHVVFENIAVDAAQENARRQVRMMIAQRTMPMATKKTDAEPEPVPLRCLLTAERPLSGKTAEEILLESFTLQRKIAELDFAPKVEGMSPEEEELMEEMDAMNYHSDDSGPDTGLRFVYVSKITEEAARKACTEAFEHARKQAEMLAGAAGVKMGALNQLSVMLSKNPSQGHSFGHQEQDYFLMQLIGSQQFGESDKQLEGLAATPEASAFIFTVQVSFLIEK